MLISSHQTQTENCARNDDTGHHHYNSVRLHEAIGYVTPDDEHQGRGETIRAARTHGMRDADQKRRAWHRSQQ